MGKLVLVGTPIGNLADISPRTRDSLAAADVVAAEDTRHSGLLLQHLGLKKPLISYYQHKSERARRTFASSFIKGGNSSSCYGCRYACHFRSGVGNRSGGCCCWP